MKLVKNFLFAALLTCTLAFNTFAGDVETPGNPVPKPLTYTEDPLITEPTTDGADTQNTEAVTSDPSDYLFYEALVALLSVY